MFSRQQIHKNHVFETARGDYLPQTITLFSPVSSGWPVMVLSVCLHLTLTGIHQNKLCPHCFVVILHERFWNTEDVAKI